MRFDQRRTRTTTLLAALLLVAAPCQQASAQSLFFDWGSSEKKDDSGRELVRLKHEGRKGELLVSFGDRRVYFIVEPGKALSYPIAIPRQQSRWSGKTSVSMKRENPAWTPTPEMLRENPRLPPWVPGGHPMNPLGTRALYLGASDYRIHGTDAPWTIGTAASKGCVRMYNKDVQDLYPRVRIGAKVVVTWDSFDPSPITDVKELQSASVFAPLNEAKDEDESERPQRKVKDEPEPERDEQSKEPATAAVEKTRASRTATGKGVDAESPIKSSSSASTTAAAPAKPAASNIETGSITKPAATVAAAAPAGPSVEEMTTRATAAAERAAAAAERAAAAAERILAAVNRANANPAIQQSGTVMSPEPVRQ